MSADFSHVSVAEDAPGHVALTGAAQDVESVVVAIDVSVRAGDETESLSLQGTRDHSVDVPTVIASVSDDQGGVWVVADDGQSAQLSA